MSGEGAGIIFGGILLLAAAPFVIATAAAIGITYAAVKIGGYLLNHAVEYAAEKKHEKELEVNNCSVELEELYRDMKVQISKETKAHETYAKEMAEQFNQIGEELKQIQKERPSAEALDKKIAESKRKIEANFGENSERVRRNIIDGGNENLKKCIETIENSMKTQAEMEIWNQQTVAALSMQKSMAETMLRDAKASVEMLEKMGASTQDLSFKKQVTTMRNAYETAKGMLDGGMYQGSFSNSRTVVRKVAILASEHVQQEMEKDLLVMEIRAKLEGLREEMKVRRVLEFCNQLREDKRLTKADLHVFSQGKYEEMQKCIDAEINELDKNADKFSLYDIQKKNDKFSELEWDARYIIEKSQTIMQGYYERLHVLEIVKKFMSEQNYKMNWVAPVGGDVSQKLVVNFSRELSGNTISITLDNDAGVGDIANMAIEILTFYDSGREVTETEKRQLREALNQALNKAGIEGTISCTGAVGEASSQTEFNRQASVRKMEIKDLV